MKSSFGAVRRGTGVLRVAKEGILSGLNNLKVYTVFDAAFGDAFGFTGDEVRGMAEYYGNGNVRRERRFPHPLGSPDKVSATVGRVNATSS